jgi:hypothetical protein
VNSKVAVLVLVANGDDRLRMLYIKNEYSFLAVSSFTTKHDEVIKMEEIFQVCESEAKIDEEQELRAVMAMSTWSLVQVMRYYIDTLRR